MIQSRLLSPQCNDVNQFSKFHLHFLVHILLKQGGVQIKEVYFNCLFLPGLQTNPRVLG